MRVVAVVNVANLDCVKGWRWLLKRLSIVKFVRRRHQNFDERSENVGRPPHIASYRKLNRGSSNGSERMGGDRRSRRKEE